MVKIVADVHHRTGRRVPLLSAAGFALAAPVLAWWAIGDLGSGWPDHDLGPYHVPVRAEYVAGVAALVIAILALGAMVGSGVRSKHGVSPLAATLVVVAGILGAAGWRVATAGSVGANIGGGGVELFGPFVLAGLFVLALVVERHARGGALPHVVLLSCIAVLTAPAMIAIERGLARYDASAGRISATDYAHVRVGDAEGPVRDLLGRPGDATSWFFPAAPPAWSCDYYSDAAFQYRICYSAGVIVGKTRSNRPVG